MEEKKSSKSHPRVKLQQNSCASASFIRNLCDGMSILGALESIKYHPAHHTVQGCIGYKQF